jgi:hypothetical protein
LGEKGDPYSDGVIGSGEKVVMEEPSMSGDGILLEGQDVTLRFGGIEALNVSLLIRRVNRSVIGLMGRGKPHCSTSRGHIPDRGEILFKVMSPA